VASLASDLRHLARLQQFGEFLFQMRLKALADLGVDPFPQRHQHRLGVLELKPLLGVVLDDDSVVELLDGELPSRFAGSERILQRPRKLLRRRLAIRPRQKLPEHFERLLRCTPRVLL